MNEWYEQAKRKLEAERNSGSYDRYASAMKGAVYEALDWFCRQDAEFGPLAFSSANSFCAAARAASASTSAQRFTVMWNFTSAPGK